jgi:hypothetical protein
MYNRDQHILAKGFAVGVTEYKEIAQELGEAVEQHPEKIDETL